MLRVLLWGLQNETNKRGRYERALCVFGEEVVNGLSCGEGVDILIYLESRTNTRGTYCAEEACMTF